MKRVRKFLIVVVCLLIAFVIYVEIANRNTKNMTYRQKVLKAIYPGLMWFTKLGGNKAKTMDNSQQAKPLTPLYSLNVVLNNGQQLPLGSLEGKKILLVNTASDCGYTSQYEDLQKLYDENKDRLVIIAFPANDFKEQEKGSDQEIAAFCKLNFGISFPLAVKSSVVKGAGQNEIFKWLSDKKLNGWNEQEPTWNFSKYLVDEKGSLINYFGPAVSPISKEVKNAIAQ
jgi:glutathione peroxidase